MLFTKRVFLAIVASIVAFSALQAQERPPLHIIHAVNDSVIDEGFNLYYHEKLNWVLTDAYKQLCSSKTASLSTIRQLNDTLLSGIMIDVDQMKCVFECRLNLNTGDIEPFNLVRGLTPQEIEHANRHVTLLEELSKLDGIENVKQAGNLNVDIVEITPSITRLYLLQGTNKSKLIPFGNDYSFDFDASCNLIARRSYHDTFIPIDFSSKDGNIGKCTHSHFHGNPFITPTDVATFLLYGHDLYQMKSFSVYSTDLKCYFTFNTDTATIVMVDDSEDMK